MNRTRAKLKSLVYVTMMGTGGFVAFSIYKGNETFYKNYVMPTIRLLEPETGHRVAIFLTKYRLIPKSNYPDSDLLKIKLFNNHLSNPIGMAAGYDKNAEAVVGLGDIGFGFIEVGSVTPVPQPGNEKPRVFRLHDDQAVINRYGFNSEGHDVVYKRLEHLKQIKKNKYCVGVNLGKNKVSTNALNDYAEGIKKFGHLADYLVINISSPNTPGLRNLQNKNILEGLLESLLAVRNQIPEQNRPPLLLKLSPDLSYEERKDIAEVVTLEKCRVDGLIVSNTTTKRPNNLKSSTLKTEIGGLSGKPITEMSTEMISDMYKLTNGMIIIGVGGIFSGRDAYEKIRAGASAVQLYTSIIYEGPPVVTKVKRELEELLKKDGFKNVSEAVGVDVHA